MRILLLILVLLCCPGCKKSASQESEHPFVTFTFTPTYNPETKQIVVPIHINVSPETKNLRGLQVHIVVRTKAQKPITQSHRVAVASNTRRVSIPPLLISAQSFSELETKTFDLTAVDSDNPKRRYELKGYRMKLGGLDEPASIPDFR